MNEKVYLTLYRTSRKDEKRKQGVVLEKHALGLIAGVFAASFALTFLIFNLHGPLASENLTGEPPARRVPLEIPSVDRGLEARAVTQAPGTTMASTLEARNVPVAESRMTVTLPGGSVSEQVQPKPETALAETIERVEVPAVDERSSSTPQIYLDPNQQNPVSAEGQQQLAALLRPQDHTEPAHADAEEDAWNSLDRTTEGTIERFLALYPDGGHASAARELLGRIANQEQARKLSFADDSAWRSVSAADRQSLEQYLTEFPAGRHTGQARQWLSEVSSASSRDSKAVIATLERYSAAWNAKDLTHIAAIRPGLGRRTAKEELSNVRSIVMRIHPTSVPKIQGDRATVDCIHQIDQVFNDGIEKQNLGVRMTYVLVKRDGNWLIAESR